MAMWTCNMGMWARISTSIHMSLLSVKVSTGEWEQKPSKTQKPYTETNTMDPPRSPLHPQRNLGDTGRDPLRKHLGNGQK